jgi:glycosyltransferase involved in cell wall biosynthesis
MGKGYRVGAERANVETLERNNHRVKVAHISTIDMALGWLLLNQLQSLQAAGYEVTGISAPGPRLPALEAAGIRHLAVPMARRVTPVADLKALVQLVGLMRRERFTIVHGHTPKGELLGQVAARLTGVPVVVDTFRGIPYRPEMHPFWRRAFLWMSRLAAACADTVLSQSEANLELAVREGVCPADKIELLGNGIDVVRFDRAALDPAAVAAVRAELGLPEGAPVVGFVGRLVAEKGLRELLAAAHLVRDRVPDVRFLLVGPGDPDKGDALEPEVAEAYGVAEACVFAGVREDMPEMYGLMDLFVLPSHRESFPRAPMEASAMGVPCVVSDVDGCRETVVDGVNGRLVPVGDAGALAGAVVDLLGEPVRARQMGEAGRRLALERFDERRVFEKVQTVYRRLLREKGLPVPGGSLENSG